ncbi:GGDEF domain-containing protein [Streptomyces sp. NPDC059009]|uniref:GGDEF domain-containing protein n=1 Tax=Streptomyces sp. NPDC059009 TaxID=3346694 RepID=UPI0036B2C861
MQRVLPAPASSLLQEPGRSPVQLPHGEAGPPGAGSPAHSAASPHTRAATTCTTCGGSFTDAVTGTLYRRIWDQRATHVLTQACRARQSLALILADVDRFKSVNDCYGHPAGDAVLHAIASVIRHESGPTGLVGRYGGCAGDEFLILLPDADLNQALVAAQSMRDQVRRLSIRARTQRDATVTLTGQTISMGLAASTCLASDALSELLLDSDGALRQAKQNGGDQIRVAMPYAHEVPQDASSPALDRQDVGVRILLAPHHCLPRKAEHELALSPLGVEHVHTILSTLLNRCTAPLNTTGQPPHQGLGHPSP